MHGIVICGGRSTRMGQDKGSLLFGSETMLMRVSRLVGEIADAVIVVGRQDQNFPPGVTVVHDPIEDLGPLAGLGAGLAASASDVNIVVACDMPLIRPAVLQRMATMIGDHDACVAVAEGHVSVLCGIYRARVSVEAQKLVASGERRAMQLLDRIDTKRVDAELLRDLDPNLDTFVSVDTQEKYHWALSLCPPPLPNP